MLSWISRRQAWFECMGMEALTTLGRLIFPVEAGFEPMTGQAVEGSLPLMFPLVRKLQDIAQMHASLIT